MTIANQEQADYWNGQEAAHWVADQARYEEMLEPIIAALLAAAELGSGDRVLDIGCGCGATTIAAARAAGPGGLARGVDLSGPMLGQARAAAAAAGVDNVSFEMGDAQVAAFEPASYDTAISRFGVMFFNDPAAAFANIRRALRPGGRLAFAAWRSMAENEWFTLPARTFAAFVPPEALPPPPSGDAPGPFALSDAARVRGLLGDAGWSEVSTDARDLGLLLGGRGSIDDAVRFIADGRAGKTFLSAMDPDGRERALAALRAGLAPYVTPEGVRMTASLWIVTARA